MSAANEEHVGALILEGPREGEFVSLPAEIAAMAPNANGELSKLDEEVQALFARLNRTLDRLIVQVKAQTDEYEAALKRLEQDG